VNIRAGLDDMESNISGTPRTFKVDMTTDSDESSQNRRRKGIPTQMTILDEPDSRNVGNNKMEPDLRTIDFDNKELKI
jgi:hypothetical protein